MVEEIEILREFFNETGHDILDLYSTVCLDHIDKTLLRNRVLNKIQMAHGKAMVLLKNQDFVLTK